jgi:hypothetical protein
VTGDPETACECCVKSINIVFRTGWLQTILILIALEAWPGALSGSGSYCVRPVQPPARTIENSQKFELGKAIFVGKAALDDQPRAQAPAQHVRLAQLQEKLPARVKKTVDLASLAGKLSREQMAALEYFLKVRYKVG